MDLKNTALLEAFKKKYSGVETDEEDLKRFAKSYYGLDKKEEPSLIEKVKQSDWYKFNLGGGPERRGASAK